MDQRIIKYKSEVEMCKAVTMMISVLLIPNYHKHIPEVPRSSHNNHSDMLFLLRNGRMFIVEYKLNNPMELLRQVMNQNNAIGIVNGRLSTKFLNEYKHKPIFSYTGQDWEIERIAKHIINYEGKINGQDYRKTNSRYSVEPTYYWGYKYSESSLYGGFKTGKRTSFYELYKQAILNLQEHYMWKLDFYLIHSILGFYEISTARKHFNDVMRNK